MARRDPPVLTFYHLDVLGSVRAITDAEGDTVTRHDFFAFGESTSSLEGDPRRFTSAVRDAETGFDHLEARYFRNVWGRMTTADDSIYSEIENPQTFNLYAYVMNNPLRWVDPSGHSAEDTQQLQSIAIPGGFRLTTFVEDEVTKQSGLLSFFLRSLNKAKEMGQHVWDWAKETVVEEVRDLGGAASRLWNGQGSWGDFLTVATAWPAFRAAGVITKSAIRVGSKKMLARKYGLNAASKTTQRIMDNIDMKVSDFVANFRAASILQELPSEVLNMTVGEALGHSKTVRKLLVDNRFAK